VPTVVQLFTPACFACLRTFWSALPLKQRERYGLAPSGLSVGVGELQEANKWGAFLSDLAQTQGESQCGESYYLATELVVVTFAKVLFGVEAPTPWPALNFYQEAEVGPVLADAGLVRGDSEPFRQTYEARSGLVLLTGSADRLCLLRTSSPSVSPGLLHRNGRRPASLRLGSDPGRSSRRSGARQPCPPQYNDSLSLCVALSRSSSGSGQDCPRRVSNYSLTRRSSASWTSGDLGSSCLRPLRATSTGVG
jgi:hypothetical protein